MNSEPHFQAESTSETWLSLLNRVYNGSLIKPRGLVTREILGCRTVVDMNNPVVCVKERKLGYHFMAAEAAWIMSGDNRVATISPFSKEIAKFSDDGIRFFGAYGPRVIDQISYIAKTLILDPDSRQAVLTIWRPNPPQTKDVPCTISAQWMIRDGKLHCFMNMRSSDAWLGVPYDWFNFSALSLGLLKMIKNSIKDDKKETIIDLGNLYFYAASQHLYEEQFEKVRDIVIAGNQSIFDIEPVNQNDFDDFDDVVKHLWGIANKDYRAPNWPWLSELV